MLILILIYLITFIDGLLFIQSEEYIKDFSPSIQYGIFSVFMQSDSLNKNADSGGYARSILNMVRLPGAKKIAEV